MKTTKFVTLGATLLLAGGILSACGSKSEDTSTSDSSEPVSSEKAEAYTGATHGTDSFDVLSKGFAENGAWLNALNKDVVATGKTLSVDGTFKDESGAEARELALYTSGDDHLPTELFTLTVDKIEVNSPNFGVAQGTVKGDIYVNAEGFHFEGSGKLEGNLIFKTEALKTAFEKLDKQPEDEKTAQKSASNQGTITGEVKVGA